MAQENILMGRDNPDGWKLEDLLKQLQKEVHAKSHLIKDSKHEQRDMILGNNKIICNNLQAAEMRQRETYQKLDAVAPNEGPNKPRL